MQLTALLAVALAALAAADVVKERAHGGDGYSPRRLRQPKQKNTCEDNRLAAVKTCEVYPRSGDCKSLQATWRSCIDTKWGYDLKKN